ncbi:metallophosphoesterase [Candidatus Pacearchaeota archaeon]|nr:metallophosphoesterase [Candidatus Pacearchaeota archaeon]
MDQKEILKFCLENGLLLDKDVLNLLSETNDLESVKLIIKKIRGDSQKKVITKTLFEKNKGEIEKVISSFPIENQKKLKIKLGLSIEISKETSIIEEEIDPVRAENKNHLGVKVLSKTPPLGKKYVMADFVTHFKNRFKDMRAILQDRSELKNLVSINKITSSSQGISVIGIVSDKKVTKNKNILLEIEDLTGKINVLVNQNKEELFEKAQDIALDAIIGFRCVGNREILFANEIVFPDTGITERKKSPVEEYALFVSDIQIGSKICMEDNFSKFIEYLNGDVADTPEIEKIKYLFLVGDVVEGVGIFPQQERELKIRDLEGQFSKLAELLGKIREDITIIISPGNHDGVRLAEPQPLLDEKYAWPIYNLKNVIITSNPALVNIGAKTGFDGFNVLLYHGFSYPYYADTVPKFIEHGDAMNNPVIIMEYLLKHRHLAPTHASSQQIPYEEDGLMIKIDPDIFVSGHTHKMDMSYYNNILVMSAATWEKQNKFQERMGNRPDFCKVPMLNLKTREVKILDFEDLPEEEKEQVTLEVSK